MADRKKNLIGLNVTKWRRIEKKKKQEPKVTLFTNVCITSGGCVCVWGGGGEGT